jgi:hypothetical protein
MGRFEPETQLGDHFARRTRGDHPTNPILSERPLQAVPLAIMINVRLYHAVDHYVKRQSGLS